MDSTPHIQFTTMQSVEEGLKLIGGDNGVVVGYSSASLVAAPQDGHVCIQLDGTCRYYDMEHAERLKSSFLVSAQPDRLDIHPCPSLNSDIVQIPNDCRVQGKYNLLIDTKSSQITVRRGTSTVKRITLKDKRIVLEDEVGNADYDLDSHLLLFAADNSASSKTALNTDEGQAGKYKFRESLGECLDGVGKVTLCSIDLETGESSEIDCHGLLPLKAFYKSFSKIILLAMDTDKLARVPGLVYCSNRPKHLYLVDGDKLVTICGQFACRSPLVNVKRDKIVYLAGPIGGPHFQASNLHIHDLETNQPLATVKDLFVGSVFGMNLPNQLWSEKIYLNFQHKIHCRIMIVSVAGEHRVISPDNQSWSVVSAFDDIVVAQTCDSLHSPSIGVFRDGQLLAKQDSPSTVPASMELLTCHEYCQGILLRPDRAHDTCIVIPHGGPNSCCLDEYIPKINALLAAGLAVCRVNYTGSSGYGQESVEKLRGNVGVLDVQDCMAMAELLMEKKHLHLHIMGGSHGGYLAAMLSSMHPSTFGKCIMLNPVISYVCSPLSSDLGESYFYDNVGLSIGIQESRPPTISELQVLLDRSPKPTSNNPPTLIMLGGVDRRVPPSNGFAWYGWLRSLGVKVDCYLYPQCNHQLDHPEADRDGLLTILSFLSS